MALIRCNECGREISDMAVACPECGYPLRPTESKPKPFPKSIIALMILAVIVAGSVLLYNNTLLGDDKAAYDIVLKCSTSFKDPSSVRIMSGCLSVDKDAMWARVSAKNGFGATITGDFFLDGEEGWILEDEERKHNFYYETEGLNFSKINAALARYWK